MTQQELDALKALADAATPGPWATGDEDGMIYVGNEFDSDTVAYCGQSLDDAAFIAAARAAVPALIAEVERLRADNAQLQQQRHAAREDAYQLGGSEGLKLARDIREERDRLRAALAAVPVPAIWHVWRYYSLGTFGTPLAEKWTAIEAWLYSQQVAPLPRPAPRE